MSVFEWTNKIRVRNLIAFANVEAGLTRADAPGPKPLEAESSQREALHKRGAAPEAETGKLKSRAESAEKETSKIKKQLGALRRTSLEIGEPDPEQDRVKTFKSLLSPQREGRMLDLGCGHGRFSLAAAQMGWKVTAVDARTDRMPTKNNEAIEWIQSDVREFAFSTDDFDCISVLGLLYHLEQSDQMDLLGKCSGTLTILDTHISAKQEVNENGYSGRYFQEPGGTEEERRTKLLASWGNARSFWPTEESLIRMARDAGFSLVAPVRPPHSRNRTFYVCYP